jgi:glycosyltransferase involved in cell wall biosynthesis
MMRDCPDPKVNPIIQEGDALISRSRNKVATHFLKNTTDEMLCFLDDDIEIDPRDLQRMMKEVHDNGYPILGAAYALKDHKKGGMAFLPENNVGEIVFGEGGKIVPVKRVSTGCMIIRREVLETFVKKEAAHFCEDSKNYAFFQHREAQVDGVWKEASEDWWFCIKAKELGFQSFLDSRPITNHWGMFPYNIDYIDTLAMKQEKKETTVLSYAL